MAAAFRAMVVLALVVALTAASGQPVKKAAAPLSTKPPAGVPKNSTAKLGHLPTMSFKSTTRARGDESAVLIKGQVKPLSTAMKCVLSLTFLYFVIMTLLRFITIKKMLAKVANQASLDAASPEARAKAEALAARKAKIRAKAATKAPPADVGKGPWEMLKDLFGARKLKMVLQASGMIPMVSVLIVFARLRARVDLETDPQDWAKMVMQILTASLFIQVLCVLLPVYPDTAIEITTTTTTTTATGTTRTTATTRASKGGCTCVRTYKMLKLLLDVIATMTTIGGIFALLISMTSLTYKQSDTVTTAMDQALAAAELPKPATDPATLLPTAPDPSP